MKIAILIYLIIGVLLKIVGPLAKKIMEAISNYKKPSFADKLSGREPKSKWPIILFELTFRILILLFYPILYLIITIDYFHSKFPKEIVKHIDKDNRLYFCKMAGAGKIKCNVCDYEAEIISFLHGHGSNKWSNTGFQCQKCGKFHHIKNDLNNSRGKKCECGGNLEREKPLFCPKCKTMEMSYDFSYIT